MGHTVTRRHARHAVTRRKAGHTPRAGSLSLALCRSLAALLLCESVRCALASRGICISRGASHAVWRGLLRAQSSSTFSSASCSPGTTARTRCLLHSTASNSHAGAAFVAYRLTRPSARALRKVQGRRGSCGRADSGPVGASMHGSIRSGHTPETQPRVADQSRLRTPLG